MKRSATILLLSILCSAAYSQNTSSALATRVTQEFMSWKSKLTITKTFLVLPQDKYVPGDTVFFSALFLTEEGHYVAGYHIIKIAILDSKGQTIHRQLVPVNDGIGGNQIILPRTMREGNYVIVAYNEYMKTFNENFYFRKEIRVVTTNSIQTDVTSMAPIIAAEGGHLVQGVKNRVVIVVPDSVTRTVTIDAEGREVAVVTLDKFGTGSFVFTPRNGDTYFAIANGKHTPFPAVEEDGCSLQLLTPFDNTLLKASIAVPSNSAWRKSDMVAALTVNGQLYYSAPFTPGRNQTTTVQFPMKDLPGGLGLISIIGSDGSLVATRHFYLSSAVPLQCNIQVAKSNFVANESIAAEISITDADGKPIEGVFTATAINENLFDHPRMVFPTDMNIASELATLVNQHPGASSSGWSTAMDNYLATQRGNISWTAIMADKEPILKAPPKFVNITGHAYFANTNQPIPDSSLVAGFMTKNGFSFDVNSRANGRLDLGFITLDGKDEMYYFIESEGKELEGVKIRWAHDSLSFRANPSKTLGRPDKYASFVTNKNAIDASFNFYTSSKPSTTISNFDSSLESALRNTGTTHNIQEYRVFPDMPELMREIIPRLFYRKNGRREMVRVIFSDPMIQPVSSPLYIIDGVLTRSTEVFLALSPADIITLKVIHDPDELARFQSIAKHGIVIVKTKNGPGGKECSAIHHSHRWYQ